MDWRVKSLSKHSHASGKPLELDQKVVSYLYKNEEGELLRADVLAEEAENFNPSGTVVGWWGHRIKPSESEAAARQAALKTTEELFLSLYEAEDETGQTEESAILKYLLALMLERKRILKPIARQEGADSRTYLLRQTKTEFEVPNMEISPETLLKAKEQLKLII